MRDRAPSFGDNRYKIVNDFQEAAYVDSSEIRGSKKSVLSGDLVPQFSPIQFPSPLKYDESNAMRYPYSQTTESREQDENLEGLYRSNLYTDSDSIEHGYDIGNIDIGESTESSRALSGELHGGRDIEIYHNPGDNPYSGESIDIEMFDGVPTNDQYATEESGENHPGSINFSLLGQPQPPISTPPPPVFKTPAGPANDRHLPPSFPAQSSRPEFTNKYVESDKLRNSRLEHDVNFGVMIAAED